MFQNTSIVLQQWFLTGGHASPGECQ